MKLVYLKIPVGNPELTSIQRAHNMRGVSEWWEYGRFLFVFVLLVFSKYFAMGVCRLLACFLFGFRVFCTRRRLPSFFPLSRGGTCSASPPALREVRGDTLTRQQAAEDLHPHADAPVVEPGLRVYADVAGHHGNRQLVENRDLLFTVPFKDLVMHKGERRIF